METKGKREDVRGMGDRETKGGRGEKGTEKRLEGENDRQRGQRNEGTEREKEEREAGMQGGYVCMYVCMYVCRNIIYSCIHMTRRDNSWVIRLYACNLLRQLLIFGSVIAI